MTIQTKKTNLKLERAKNIFWTICERLDDIKLYVTEIELGKAEQHDNAVTIYLPLDTTSAFGSLQYYGGTNLFKEGYAGKIELRFYFKFLNNKPELYSCVDQKSPYRVEDGKIYLKYHFNNKHSDNEIEEFIDKLTLDIQKTLNAIYGSEYSNLQKRELSESIKKLPKLS